MQNIYKGQGLCRKIAATIQPHKDIFQIISYAEKTAWQQII